MIRLIHIGSIALCILSVVLFVLSGVYLNRNSDPHGPEIQMDSKEIEVSIHAKEEQLLQGVTAADKKDGDVTDSLLVESQGMFISSGKRKIVIDAFDSNGNVTRAERVIKYSDYVSPRITLSGPLRAPISNINQLTEVITVEDCLEGDITDAVQLTSMRSSDTFSLPGDYRMKISVVNGVGDVVEVPVTVELYENLQDSSKAKALLSDYLIYTKVGQEIDPSQYLEGVVVQNVEYRWDDEVTGTIIPYTRNQIDIENNVKIDTPGVYDVIYSITENSFTTQIRMIVIVEE